MLNYHHNHHHPHLKNRDHSLLLPLLLLVIYLQQYNFLFARPNDRIIQLDEIDTDGMFHDDLLDQFLIIEWPNMSIVSSCFLINFTKYNKEETCKCLKQERDFYHVILLFNSLLQKNIQPPPTNLDVHST